MQEESWRKRSMEKRQRKIPGTGKHSGAILPGKEERKEIRLSDIDLPATVRRAMMEGTDLPDAVMLKRYSIRRKNTILFVVDASRSQGAGERLAFAKGAVLALLSEAYCERSRVGLITFGNSHAQIVLPITGSVDLAAEKMQDLKAAGNTPLGMGLRLALQTIETEQRKHPEQMSLLVLLTDGKANYDSEKGKPLSLAVQAAEEIQKRQIPTLVIDTENSVFNMGLAEKIAKAAGAEYVTL